MKKSVWKKSLAVGLAFTMMLSMTACGGSKGGKSSSDESNGDVKDMVFAGEKLDIKDIKGDPSSITVSGDKIYIYSMEWPEYDEEDLENDASENTDETEETTEEIRSEESADEGTTQEADGTNESTQDDGTTEDEASAEESTSTEDEDIGADGEAMDDFQQTARIYSMNLDATGITEICEPKLETNEYVNYMMVNNEGRIVLSTSSWNENDDSQMHYIIPIDENGNVSEHIDITGKLKLGQDDYISRMVMDDKGQIVVLAENKIIVLDSDYNNVNEISLDNVWIEGAALSPDGKVLCACSDENGAGVRVLDMDAKKLGDKYDLNIRYFQGSDSLMSGNGDYDFFYRDDTGVYGYSINDKKSTKLLDFVASELNTNDIYSIVPVSSDTMIGTGWDEEGSIFTMYKKVNPADVKDKITITYGSLWGVDDNVKSAAIDFNKSNDKYRIEFKDYSNVDDSGGESAWEDSVKKMNADIVAGNVTDIIDLNMMPVGQYIEKGILEDLTSYFDKDSDVKKDDIVPAVRKAMEVDGKLYYISPGFSISTLVAAKKDVGDKTGWTFDEMKALLEEKGDSVRPFYLENKNDILNCFLYSNVDEYIDWTTGKCRFDSDDFKSVLEISNKGQDEETEWDEDSPSMPSLIKSGKILFIEGYMETDYVQLYKKMYNQDITFIGYPCEDKQGSYFSFNNQMGIYSKSEVKDGAWEFIKYFMTKEYQGKYENIWGSNPTNAEAFEMYMKRKTATKKYTDELGQEVEPYQNSWGWDDLDVEIGPLSAEEEKLYRDLIDNTTKVTATNDEVMNIIADEAKNYFSGQKSLEETVDIIQNRVTTYVNENR